MKKVLLIVCLLSFSFISCNRETQLETPENIFFDGVLVWDQVEDASSYTLTVNGLIYELDIPYYDGLKEEGTYIIEVVAKGEEPLLDSEKETYILLIDYNQDDIIHFQRDHYRLSWTKVNQATHYLVSDGQTFARVTDNYFDLNDVLTDEIFVQAVFPDGSKTDVFNYLISNEPA